jgi:hypothetical protein
MEEFGYVEGRDFDVAARYAEGDVTRMPALAADRRHFIDQPLAWPQET